MKIAVFMGGTSSEKEISLRSGEAVLESLQRQGYDAYGVVLDENNQVTAFLENDYDLAYLVLHGGNGENGKIQAVLDILGKKYTGSGVLASALTMDKNKTKQIAENIGIRVPKSYRDLDSIERFPVIIKPVDEGSSKGLFLCNNKEEAGEALKKLRKPIIEDYIVGEELTVGVLNGKALGVLKIIPQADVLYDYDSKYAKGGSIHEFPAKIEDKSYKEAMKIAERIHKEFKMKGISRSDFILSEGKLYFLEVNSSPGMTKTSLIPDLATLQGYTFDDVVRLTVETFLK
ncbi:MULTISPECIES: D-alanine--D-alanine ligase [Fusobacterium]|jgi:D-ala D-ala ligase N-terminal domain protein|uniref:D-alanine--D-alanine ligase n=2 Tax=Fusobacterium TaxID=848 RepID=A0A2G9EH59_9FUSO|nr:MULTISPECIES: D-alanine--D-alanine ligase [Fusobacterium]MBF1193960.1 D-alanine--D-alanine ligase [Fusobacterium periodonticum]ATV69755.1 D-alanine--D-alanine ligase [Fusobacterium pseudoperiodonticum]EKA94500.1 D-alanine-D-alanine ligase [Fusobacterium periodonticum D10]MBF1197822.1 D-alanine--D-alanine ligase [Fusobacterium periodonticum]MBF1204994.1 D-alanine--D-alanine ligase [Fusobacterium periodonticum]